MAETRSIDDEHSIFPSLVWRENGAAFPPSTRNLFRALAKTLSKSEMRTSPLIISTLVGELTRLPGIGEAKANHFIAFSLPHSYRVPDRLAEAWRLPNKTTTVPMLYERWVHSLEILDTQPELLLDRLAPATAGRIISQRLHHQAEKSHTPHQKLFTRNDVRVLREWREGWRYL